jgi:hypothetical protein
MNKYKIRLERVQSIDIEVEATTAIRAQEQAQAQYPKYRVYGITWLNAPLEPSVVRIRKPRATKKLA